MPSHEQWTSSALLPLPIRLPPLQGDTLRMGWGGIGCELPSTSPAISIVADQSLILFHHLLPVTLQREKTEPNLRTLSHLKKVHILTNMPPFNSRDHGQWQSIIQSAPYPPHPRPPLCLPPQVKITRITIYPTRPRQRLGPRSQPGWQ